MSSVLYEIFPDPDKALPNGWQLRLVEDIIDVYQSWLSLIPA
jgi:hypothetical protein